MHQWPAYSFRRVFEPGLRERIVGALLEGGDDRLRLDARGVNKYLCPPLPSATLTCLSSCTASPISDVGFAAASCAFKRIAGSSSRALAARRGAELACEVESGIRAYLGLGRNSPVIVSASGTDAILIASVLLALAAGGRPMTAILPAASETGSGVPMAAGCRWFDGVESGRPVLDERGEVVTVALRGPDGLPREAGAVSEDVRAAVRTARGRAVVFLTHGTKTGLIALDEVPVGVEVIVDACQLRLSPAAVRAYLARGWPVVVTGSKFLGGPAFSGAVLLPPGRFSEVHCRRAVALCAGSDAKGAFPAGVSGIGPLLRWSAALAGLNETSGMDLDEAVLRLESAVVAQVRSLAGAHLMPRSGGCPGIVTFAVEEVGRPGKWMSADALRPVYRALAEAGVLLGQPVDLGPFGGLRAAIGVRDVMRGSLDASLRSLNEAWAAVREGAPRARAA